MSLDIYFSTETEDVYWRNITHNLNTMAEKAGIYQCLWRPEENGLTKASHLIEPLNSGLLKLWASPDFYEQFESPNGWGQYDHLVEFVIDVLKHAARYPDAQVTTRR